MIITVLSRKVNPQKDFKKGVHVIADPDIYEDIVKKLNKIIDWNSSVFPIDPSTKKVVRKDVSDKIGQLMFMATLQNGDDPNFDPKKLVDTLIQAETIEGIGSNIKEENGVYMADVIEYDQDRNFLGANPSLSLGDCFKWKEDHSFAVVEIDGKTTLALINTTTGQGVIKRFITEYIIPEYDFEYKDGVIDFDIQQIDFQSIQQCPLLDPDDGADLSCLNLQLGLHESIKLKYGNFRYLLNQVPELKYQLVTCKNILHIECSPIMDKTDLWIDSSGNIAFHTSDFSNLFGMSKDDFFTYLLAELLTYFRDYPTALPPIPDIPEEVLED